MLRPLFTRPMVFGFMACAMMAAQPSHANPDMQAFINACSKTGPTDATARAWYDLGMASGVPRDLMCRHAVIEGGRMMANDPSMRALPPTDQDRIRAEALKNLTARAQQPERMAQAWNAVIVHRLNKWSEDERKVYFQAAQDNHPRKDMIVGWVFNDSFSLALIGRLIAAPAIWEAVRADAVSNKRPPPDRRTRPHAALEEGALSGYCFDGPSPSIGLGYELYQFMRLLDISDMDPPMLSHGQVACGYVAEAMYAQMTDAQKQKYSPPGDWAPLTALAENLKEGLMNKYFTAVAQDWARDAGGETALRQMLAQAKRDQAKAQTFLNALIERLRSTATPFAQPIIQRAEALGS